MFKIYITIVIVLFWVINPVLAQEEKPTRITLMAGVSGQINGITVDASQMVFAESGNTIRSSQGLGIPVALQINLQRIFLRTVITNRYTKTVDHSAKAKEDVNKFVQDFHLLVGKKFISSNKFYNNISLSVGPSIFSVGQKYEGGKVFIQQPDPAGGTVWVDVTPTTLQFPAITFNVSKLLFSRFECMLGVSMYDTEWRQDFFGNGLATILRLDIYYVIGFKRK